MLVAEDEEPLRAAICDLIEAQSSLAVAAVAADADEAIAHAGRVQPDVALLDVRMPGGGGPRAAREIRTISPATRTVALSAYKDRAHVLEMLRAGAVGYVVKGDAPGEIVEAIERAARDQGSLSGPLVADLVGELPRQIGDDAIQKLVHGSSDDRFRDLFESAPDAIVVLNPDGRILVVNGQTESLFGYHRHELIGEPVEIIVPVGLREGEAVLGGDDGAGAQPPRSGLELGALRKNGTHFPVEISASSAQTDEGVLTTAFVRDISERKAGEAARLRDDARLEALLESAPDAVVICDGEGRIVLVNRETERLFGRARSTLIGTPVELLVPERLRERHVLLRTRYLADPRRRPLGAGLRLIGLRADAAEFPVDVSLSTIETDDGPLTAAFIRDASERDAATELERAAAERRAVVAHLVSASEEERRRIANDIHDDSIQVMTAAGMRLQILRGVLAESDQLEKLGALEQTIQLSINRLRHLLFELRPPALDHDGLGAALRLYLEETGRDASTSYRLDDHLLSQPPRETRVILYRIAQEVLTNTRKHARAEMVTVTLSERDGGYGIRVEDDGVGFASEATAPRPGHLGLAAIRERAEVVGGWLQIRSMPERGTTVEFWIPTTGESESAPSEAMSEPRS